MIITVTQDDIDKGQRNDCSCCPVALAISRALGVTILVESHTWRRYTGHNKGLHPNAVVFVNMFDHGYEVEPFEFELGPT